MIAIVFVDFLLVNAILASNDVYVAREWRPVDRSFVLNQIRNSYTGARHAGDWNPSQENAGTNIDFLKEYAIKIITPEQAHILSNEKTANAWPPSEEAAAANEGSSLKAVTESNQNQDQTLLKLDNNMQEGNVKTEVNRRASKQIWDHRSTEDLIFNSVSSAEASVKSTDTEHLINVKNTTYNSYEVTESANVQELTRESNNLPNEYTNKFVTLLSKYNIKDNDKLHNYATSKLHRKNLLYPTALSPVSLIPFRYNSLNHLPVNPVLAVLLSNYGYYLHGFYGLQNNYKNLYGYSASNSIHNNKPFGSYKIFSDTDSSN